MSEGGKAERILHDNGISAPISRIFPMKREIREEKGEIGAVWHAVFHCNL